MFIVIIRGAARKTTVKSKLNLKLNIIKTKRKVNALITFYWIAFLDVNSILVLILTVGSILI
jgi:hypothetical protein